MDAGLTGKTVIVTGGSGGIGQQIVRSFREENANVAIHFFRGRQRAQDLLNELNTERAITVGADLRIESDVIAMFDQVHQQLGSVDILIANAGVWPDSYVPLVEMSLDQWNGTLETDLTSVFLCLREFLRRAVSDGVEQPAAVIVGSTAGEFGEAGHADYATSKSGLMYGLLRSLKNEVSRVTTGGRINCVCPGWTITPMTEKFAADQRSTKRALQTIPMKKFGNPSDVAAAVVFLASQRLAGHITGQALFVSGGMEGRVIHEMEEVDLEAIIDSVS